MWRKQANNGVCVYRCVCGANQCNQGESACRLPCLAVLLPMQLRLLCTEKKPVLKHSWSLVLSTVCGSEMAYKVGMWMKTKTSFKTCKLLYATLALISRNTHFCLIMFLRLIQGCMWVSLHLPWETLYRLLTVCSIYKIAQFYQVYLVPLVWVITDVEQKVKLCFYSFNQMRGKQVLN